MVRPLHYGQAKYRNSSTAKLDVYVCAWVRACVCVGACVGACVCVCVRVMHTHSCISVRFLIAVWIL